MPLLTEAVDLAVGRVEGGEQGGRAPVGGVRRLLAGGHAYHPPDETGADLGGSTGSGRITLQPRHAHGEEPPTPTRHFLGSDLHRGSDFFVLSAFGCQQHDTSTFHHSCRKRPAAGPLLQSRSLVSTQGNGWGDPHPLVSCLLDGCGSIKVITYDALH